MPDFDRAAENIGNVVALEHVNTAVPDQQLALTFYVTGLGLTRDPYLRTGTDNMWVNVGRSQFHLPSRATQVLRGCTGLVMPGRETLLERLQTVAGALDGTRFAFAEHDDHVAVTCPWGNRIRCHVPGEAWGPMRLGMAYVEFDVPTGTAAGIAQFYNQVMAAPTSLVADDEPACARVAVGEDQTLFFRETDAAQIAFDGHHIAIYLADFSGPYGRLGERRLISMETNRHEYRFTDIVDPDDGTVLFQLEHEVRSMRHPLFSRRLVNRNPNLTAESYSGDKENLAVADRRGSGTP